ncbi:DNA/RNA polymerases family protein [Synechococcus sp. A18-40]|nr:DNA/RNA polymerases family protein [Synechococcus sp. A18-40]
MENLSDHIYVHKVSAEHCLHVVQAQIATLQELIPGTFNDDELDLYMTLWGHEDTLEERIKTERRQRLLLANVEELVFLDLLRLIYMHALEKNINGYQAASTQMRRRFGKTEQALKPDLLKLLRDEHAESAYSVGAVDLNEIHSLEYALEGFIPNEEVTHVFAPWGDGKTALALGMTKALIKGTGFLDQQVGREPQSVLYINTDAGAGRFKSAFEELNMDSDQRFTSGEWLTVWAPDASQGKEGWSASLSNFIALREAIEDGGYGVVIIDSVKGMLSGTGYDYQDNQTVNQMVKMLREVIAMPCECAVVLINHKGTDEKEGAGAKAWSEATGQVIELKTPQGKDKQPLRHLREVIIRKDSIGGRRRLFTKLENGEHVVTEGTEVVNDGTDLVLQWFKSKAVAGKPKWQRKDVIAEESGLVPEVSVPTVDRALKALSGHAGQLKKLKGGWYELKAQHS